MATLATAAIILSGLGATAASADESGPTETYVIDGRVFEVTSDPQSMPAGGSTTGGIMAAALRTVWWGTSYALNDHYTEITYYGEARARANQYEGQRVIAAMFKYTRDGVNVINWQKSSATVNSSCVWSAGSAIGRTVYDSLDPNAPVTKWAYDRKLTALGAC